MEKFISRKDRIILSAIDIIDELGMQGLSTKELAYRQNINESALYRHFKNKEEIIEEVIDYFSRFDTSIYNSVKQYELNPKEKVLKYTELYLEYYESYPAITAILFSYETLRHNSVIKAKLDTILKNRINNSMLLIQEGQDKNQISKLFTAREMTFIIWGYCNRIIEEWKNVNYETSFKKEVLSTINKLLSVT